MRNGTPAYMAPEQLAGRGSNHQERHLRAGPGALRDLHRQAAVRIRHSCRAGAGAARERAGQSFDLRARSGSAVERVILRCLSPKPAMRPASALAVAAALPGGDPLAAALAAGETPSPEMVAAAGEGEGLASAGGDSAAARPCLLGLPHRIWRCARARLWRWRRITDRRCWRRSRRDMLGQTRDAPRGRSDEAYTYEWDNGLFEWFSSSIRTRIGTRCWLPIRRRFNSIIVHT